MNNDIKPIDTIYKGYRFRSRLEARWAVFLDACGADWEYEAEGFDLGDGVFYLPDFVIHNAMIRGDRKADLYVEVKSKITDDDARKIKKFQKPMLDWSGEYPIEVDSPRPIIVLGKIPYAKNLDTLSIDISEACYGENKLRDVEFFSFSNIDCDNYAAYPCVLTRGGFGVLGGDYLDEMDEARTLRAYLMARQARFEHGENG